MFFSRMPTKVCARMNFLKQPKRYKNFSSMYGVSKGKCWRFDLMRKISIININEGNLEGKLYKNLCKCEWMQWYQKRALHFHVTGQKNSLYEFPNFSILSGNFPIFPENFPENFPRFNFSGKLDNPNLNWHLKQTDAQNYAINVTVRRKHDRNMVEDW